MSGMMERACSFSSLLSKMSFIRPLLSIKCGSAPNSVWQICVGDPGFASPLCVAGGISEKSCCTEQQNGSTSPAVEVWKMTCFGNGKSLSPSTGVKKV